MAKKVGIYKITSPSGRVYIGQSWNIFQRWNEHRSLKRKGNHKLENSLKKYGSENHTFEIIHELPADTDQSILDTYEILYISQYKECGIELLNLKDGGSGGKHSAESIRKMSDSKKRSGKRLTEEERRRISLRMSGRIVSQETRDRKRKALLGHKTSAETKEKIKQAILNNNKGKIHFNKDKKKTEEQKRKQSDIMKGRYVGDKHPLFGKPRSEETKQKIRIANLGKRRVCK